MDQGKMMIQEDARKAKAKEVKIKFTTAHEFIVLDEEGNQKYNGSLYPLNCSCPSFLHLNPDKHMDSHGELAKCKHIFAAEVKKVYHNKQENRLRQSIRDRETTQKLRGKDPKGFESKEAKGAMK